MRTFKHWRNVGRALMAARKKVGKDGFTRVRDEFSDERVFTWSADSGDAIGVVTLAFYDGDDSYRLGLDMDGMWLTDGFFGEAVDTLRVLAALDLIPADIAYAADERYGRCEVCGRLAQWWHDSPFYPRWVHVPPMSAARPGVHRAEVADIPADLAEVAGEQRCQSCAPGYDCESGVYTRPEVTE